MLKMTYFLADNVITIQMGVDKPVNYGILFFILVILSYVPTFFLNILLGSFREKKLYHGSEQAQRFEFNKSDGGQA